MKTFLALIALFSISATAQASTSQQARVAAERLVRQGYLGYVDECATSRNAVGCLAARASVTQSWGYTIVSFTGNAFCSYAVYFDNQTGKIAEQYSSRSFECAGNY